MRIEIRKEQLPWGMAAGRALLGPVVMIGEKCGWSGLGLAALVVTALVSDIFDGVLARRWKCDTAAVRLFDTIADTIFYLCAGIALWIGQPQIWANHAGLLAALLGIEAVRWAIEFRKFGKPASYHSYLAKAWGLALATGIVAVFAMQRDSVLLTIGLAMGLVSNAEGLAMSLILPVWRRDVKTFAAAWTIRKGIAATEPATVGRRRLVTKIAAGSAALLALCLAAAPARAVEPTQATYISGSAKIAAGTPGTLDTTSATGLLFRYKDAAGAPAEIAIPYANIRSFEPRHDVVRHLGFLPALAVGLVAARQRRYTLSISYTDSAAAPEVAIFEMPEREQRTLQTILHGRAPQSCAVSQWSAACAARPAPKPAVPPAPAPPPSAPAN